MDEKIAAGQLYREALPHRDLPANKPEYAGGTSRFFLVKTTSHDRHIGTIHEITILDGSIPHGPHPENYTLRDCSRIRSPDPKDKPETLAHLQSPP